MNLWIWAALFMLGFLIGYAIAAEVERTKYEKALEALDRLRRKDWDYDGGW